MRKLLAACLITIITIQVSAQTKTAVTPATKVVATAKQMGASLLKKDFSIFLKTTYPEALKRTEGGTEKMMHDMKKQLSNLEASGNSIIGAWPGKPSQMIDTAGELQCTLPHFLKMKLPNGLLTTETTLICLSPDKGNTWYFIDATDKNLQEWRSLFPNISSRLVIPQPKDPIFTKSEELQKELNKRN